VWVKAGAIIPMGPDLDYVEQKPLDPLTLELYHPQGEGEIVIYDEDKPEIKARYACQPDAVNVHVSAAPGQVELVLYGAPVSAAIKDGQALALVDQAGGQRVCFDGQQPGAVILSLKR
jgi:hypothetical protein